MKLSVIGGGGVRSMFLARSLTQRARELGIDTIVFMDNNPEKLRVFGGMARQVARRIDPGVRFVLTGSPVEAVTDADYAITTMRVGGDSKRVDDETAALELGLLGQETTGAAGFSFAMRSVPALAEYCELVRRYAKPGAKVFNFTNPAGLVSQALRDMGYDFTFGICDAPSGMLHAFAKALGERPDALTGECYGLNHLSFFERVMLNGRDIMPELMADPRAYRDTDLRFFEPELVKRLGQIPNEYLYYFFYPERAVSNIRASGTTRGTVIRDVNLKMLEELSRMDVERDFDACLAVFEKWHGIRENSYMQNETQTDAHKPPFRFDVYSQDAGGYAGVALKYIEAERTGKATQMILCVPNRGAIAGLEDDDVVEVSCDITKDGCAPHRFPHPARIPMEYIRRVKLYERLGSEAIGERDAQKAVDCLMVHPLVGSYSLAKRLVARYIELGGDYIGGWK
ncbi:6-phospho-beta-glucosidase [Bacillota bacterium Meth-B3]